MSEAPRLSVSLTFDFDAMSVWIGSHNSNNPAQISRGEFGAVAVPRILDLLERHSIATTFFIPGHTALAYPGLIRDIRDRGHEIGHHGWVHENPATLRPRRRARGLRAAASRPSRRSPASSRRATDRPRSTSARTRSTSCSRTASPTTLPVRLPTSRRTTCGRATSGRTTEPYASARPSTSSRSPSTGGSATSPTSSSPRASPSLRTRRRRCTRSGRASSTTHMRTARGRISDIALHPQSIGRGHRLVMVEQLIEHMASHEGVVFEPMA